MTIEDQFMNMTCRKLEPNDNFTTNFTIANTCILNQISTMMTSSSPIRAELCKLNIYSNGTHHHITTDHTPSSSDIDVFVTLIVCLPSSFTGGELSRT